LLAWLKSWSQDFKIWFLTDEWKYISHGNGGANNSSSQTRSSELSNCVSSSLESEMTLMLGCESMRFRRNGRTRGDKLRVFHSASGTERIYQFDLSQGVLGFPDKPEDALRSFDRHLETSEVRWKRRRMIAKSWPRLEAGDRITALYRTSRRLRSRRGDDIQSSHHVSLRQHHSLLDIGCGSLRIGRL